MTPEEQLNKLINDQEEKLKDYTSYFYRAYGGREFYAMYLDAMCEAPKFISFEEFYKNCQEDCQD